MTKFPLRAQSSSILKMIFCRRIGGAIVLGLMSLTCLPVQAHLISNPSIPKPAIEATVELSWPSELDERPERISESRFADPVAMARFDSRPAAPINLLEFETTGSTQPFFIGAQFGEGSLIGFRFVDFGPYGQDFVRTQFEDEQFDGFIPLPGEFAGFLKFGRSGAGGDSNGSNTAANALASRGGGGAAGDGVNLSGGAYNPLSFQHLFRFSGGGSTDGGGGGDGSFSSGNSDELIASMGLTKGPLFGRLGRFERGTFDGDWTDHDFGPLDPCGFPWGVRPGIGLGLGVLPFVHPIQSFLLYCCWDPCGPGGGTPILGFPFGIFNPILGPFGPFGAPFPILHLILCHHPPCIPEPSQWAMLVTLIPGLGMYLRARRTRKQPLDEMA